MTKILPAGKYVWGDRRKVHKQGKLVKDVVPIFLETYQGMSKIRPLAPEVFGKTEVQPDYPDYWIDPNDLVEQEPTPPTPVGTVSDEELANALVVVIKYIKQ